MEPEWQGHFAPLALGPLDGAESAELLRRRGYPEVGRAALEGVDILPLFLTETVSPDVRCAIEASSVLRWVTLPLLAALVPTLDAPAIWEELGRLAV